MKKHETKFMESLATPPSTDRGRVPSQKTCGKENDSKLTKREGGETHQKRRNKTQGSDWANPMRDFGKW
ncbi:hypothetical protein CEXT_32591 [Caerostris extrusa]|uniref:Uncharacterized protein n=1 Tax=Caerostris extrusa TaxID=172846 RepID=A0AAV4SK72_CAEEX|nr:hypothetical protein CEXT_32591 [Caerostris extrusa]